MSGAEGRLDDPEAIVAGFEARARRIETPCGDGTMVWRVWGEDRSGIAPLVVGHGAQGAWSHWIRNIDALSEMRLLVAVDLPGQGDSAMPATPDHRGISQALADGLPIVLGDARAADFAGFSFSGCAFAHFAAWYPALVRRLILIGTGGLDTPHGHINLQRVAGLRGEARQAMLKSNLLGLMLHHPDTVDDLAMHLLVLNGRKARLVRPDMVVPDRLIRMLPEIGCPVDAIWGEFDRPHPHPAVQEAAIRSVQPGTDFRVVADAGHWAMYERTEAFNATLLAMLDQPLRAGQR